MAIKRIVSTDFWTDNKVVDMFSPEDKLFMLYLLTNPHASLLGIYPLSVRVASFEIGFSVEAIKVLIERFQNKYGVILYSENTQEIAVLNWLKHSIIKGGKPVMDALVTDVKKIKEKQLLSKVLNRLKDDDSLIPTVREFVDNQIQTINTEVIEDVDMDMVMGMDMDMELRGRNVVRNANVTYPNHKTPAKPVRHKYGSYDNVLLSDEELEKLKTEFPYDWENRIERLSEYIASTGKKYNNYLATIRSWARKDKKGGEQNVPSRKAGILPKPEKGSFIECRNLV